MSTENDTYVAGLVTTALGVQAGPTELHLDGWGRADVHVALGDRHHVFIEVETDQKHPSTNVLKYWPWLEAHPDERVLLVHAFIKPIKVSPNRLQLSRWTGERMTKDLAGRFRYCRMDVTPGQSDRAALDAILAARDELLR